MSVNIFDKLGKIYIEIDNNYASIEVHARSKGYNKKEVEYNNKRQFNDQAYFLFMFTRLESLVRDLTDELIESKFSTLTDWKIKRTWEIIHVQKTNNSLNFMNRVALLTPKGNADYNLIRQYYNQRNNIGHGGSFTIPISIPNVIADMKYLFRELSK